MFLTILSLSSFELPIFEFSKFFLTFKLERNKGPKIFPIFSPKFEAFLYPIILKIKKKILIKKNSKKYFITFIDNF